MKLKYISMLVLGASLGLTSCNDFLDKEPESNVTPAAFFTAESDLAAYTINLYGVLTSIAPGSYGMGTFAYRIQPVYSCTARKIDVYTAHKVMLTWIYRNFVLSHIDTLFHELFINHRKSVSYKISVLV